MSQMLQGNAAWNETGKCRREMLQGTIERNIELRRNEWQNGLALHPQQAGFGTSDQSEQLPMNAAVIFCSRESTHL